MDVHKTVMPLIALKVAIRAGDIARGLSVPVSSLPQREPMKAARPKEFWACQSVEKVAERHFFGLSQVLPLAFAPGLPLRLPLERERELSRGVSDKPPRPNGGKRRCILADVTPCPRLLRREEYHPRCELTPGTALRGLKD